MITVAGLLGLGQLVEEWPELDRPAAALTEDSQNLDSAGITLVPKQALLSGCWGNDLGQYEHALNYTTASSGRRVSRQPDEDEADCGYRAGKARSQSRSASSSMVGRRASLRSHSVGRPRSP